MNQFEPQSPCEWMQDRIDLYADGELSPAEAAVADLHLTRCLRCANELQLARQVTGALRSLPAVRCPDSIPEAVRARIAATGTARRSETPWPWYYRWQEFFKRPAIVGVTTALLLVVITAIFGEKQAPRSEFTQEQIEQAELDAKLALAYIGKVTSRAGVTVREDVFERRVFEPIMRAVQRKSDTQTTTQSQGVNNAG